MSTNENRIASCFAQLKSQGKKALVAYIVSGDPNEELTLQTMKLLVETGVDIIELGVPFSDPMAEGKVIQKGHERALENNTSLRTTMDLVSRFRKENQSVPVVLMGYANPVERMGYSDFAIRASESGVDGLLTVDLPPEECAELHTELQARGIDNIFLVAPTSSEARIEKVLSLASGFVYYVSLKGVTGASNLDIESVKTKVEFITSKTQLPLAVGFGIKDAESATAIGALADGVVVGSALVEIMGREISDQEKLSNLKEKIASIREALDPVKFLKGCGKPAQNVKQFYTVQS